MSHVSREYHHPPFSLSPSFVHHVVGHNASRWSMIQSHPIQTHTGSISPSVSLNAQAHFDLIQGLDWFDLIKDDFDETFIIIAYRLEGHASIEHHHQAQEDALEREVLFFVPSSIGSLLRCFVASVSLSCLVCVVASPSLGLALGRWRISFGCRCERERERETL